MGRLTCSLFHTVGLYGLHTLASHRPRVLMTASISQAGTVVEDRVINSVRHETALFIVAQSTLEWNKAGCDW